MLRPTTPSSVTASVSTRGDSETTPLAVLWGCIGTQTARTFSARSFVGLFGIMKNNTESPAIAGGDFADAVPDCYAVGTALPGGGPVPCCDHERIALAWQKRAAHRLRARRVLDQQELAAAVIAAGLRKEADHLERESDLAVDVLVEAVEIARAVAEHQRRWASLAVPVALLE